MDIQHSLIEMIKHADRRGATSLLKEWTSVNAMETLFTDLLEPVLLQIGEEWYAEGSVSIAQSYVAAKIAEDAFAMIAAGTPRGSDSEAKKGPVIIGNIEDDFHSLGRRMIVTFLKADGWIVHDLGNDVPPKVFVDKAEEVGARVIGASAMTRTTAHKILGLRDEIDRRGLKDRIKLAVGGAAFLACSDLVQEVRADGTASNAVSAVKLFAKLFTQSEALEGPR